MVSAALARSAPMPALDPAHDSVHSLLAILYGSGGVDDASAQGLPHGAVAAEAASYLRSLSTLSLHDLRSQPDQLDFKAKDLDRQLSDLCITQTDAFIRLYQAEQSFVPALSSLSGNLDTLLTKSLPDLESAAAAFHEASQPCLHERQRIQALADEYERGSLADLLELPKLVETCVRARHYAEALQLGDHIATLTLGAFQGRHSSPQGLHSSLVAAPSKRSTVQGSGDRSDRHGEVLISLLYETWTHLSKMKMDLVATMQRPGLQLPSAKKAASLLRKLHTLGQHINPLSKLSLSVIASFPDLRLDPSQLCLCYLRARYRLLNESLDRIVGATIDVGAYLRRYIDAWREGLTETLGIATALFSGPDDMGSVSGGSSAVLTPSYLLSAYTCTALDKLRATLEAQLPRLGHPSSAFSGSTKNVASVEDSASMFAAVHTQLSYTSAALSRYGLDFGPMLVYAGTSHVAQKRAAPALDLLELSWLDVLRGQIAAAFQGCTATLPLDPSTRPSVKGERKSGPTMPSAWLISAPRSAELVALPISRINSIDLAFAPDAAVAHFPPFVALLNGIAAVFNGLRLFAPQRLAPLLQSTLEAQYVDLADRLLRYAEGIEAAEALSFSSGLVEAALSDGDADLFVDLSAEQHQSLELELRREGELAVLSRSLVAFDRLLVQWTTYVLQCGVYGRSCETATRLDAELQSSLARLVDFAERCEENRRRNGGRRSEEAKSRQAARLQRLEEEEQRRKAEEEERRCAEEAEAARLRKVQKEQERLRMEAEEKARTEEARRIAEEERKRKDDEEERRRKQEEERKRKEQEAERIKKEAEEEQKRREAEEAERKRRAAEEEAEKLRRQQQEEKEERRRKEEEKARHVAEEEERERKRQEVEVAAAAREAEEERQRQEHEEHRRKQEKQRLEAEDEERKWREAAEAERRRVEAEEAERREQEEEEKQRVERERAAQEKEREAKEQEERDKAVAAAAAAAAGAGAVVAAEKQRQLEGQEGQSMQGAEAAEAAAEHKPEDRPVKAETKRDEANMAPPLTTTATMTSLSSVKKTNLAEKLRLRKEQREREAAAAKVATSKQDVDQQPAQPSANEAGTADEEAAAATAKTGAEAAVNETEQATSKEAETAATPAEAKSHTTTSDASAAPCSEAGNEDEPA
ncbi:hypothetical protein ACQY0O_001685 [Thecaphora frezii]